MLCLRSIGWITERKMEEGIVGISGGQGKGLFQGIAIYFRLGGRDMDTGFGILEREGIRGSFHISTVF